MFKSCFHGRTDVYAKLWVNTRTGKRGYSPACKHEWVRSLCRKPAIKCSECPNQQFLPLDETAVRQHLDGRQVIGVYPILKNESCHFLAIDFDKGSWMEDVRAVMATCREEGFDAPRLDTLFLTMPSSFKGKIVQYAGRLHRYHKDKQNIQIYDYVDDKVSVLARMYQRRLKTYKMLGYEVKKEGLEAAIL